MDRIKRFTNKYPPSTLILILFFVTSLFFICFAILDLEASRNALREDGIIEYLQAILFLVGAGLWGFAFIITPKGGKSRRYRRLFYILFMGLYIFLFLEEISWGQRIFGITTPEFLRDMNQQGETNLHNIYSRESEIWVQILHACLFVTLVIIIPLLYLGSKRIGSFFKRINFPIVHPDLIICFGMSLNFYHHPGFHWSIALRTVYLIAPIIVVLSGKFRWFLSHFKYPLLQVSLLAVIGFLLIALNLNPGTFQYINNNVAWEIRELLIAMALFFFSAYEAHGAWRKKHKGLDNQIG
jgi:hypothetical protein